MIQFIITRSPLLNLFIQIAIVGLIFWLIFWFVDYIKLPEPFNKVLKVVVAIFAVLFLINALLAITGTPFIRW